MWDLEDFMKLQWSKVYRLTSDNVDEYVPESPGVYRISVELKNNKLKVVYVGQTKDLEDRLNQYVNSDTDNDCLLNHLEKHICYFRVAKVADDDDRDGAERALYDHFKPECNDEDKIPDVEPADINFD